MGMVFNYRCRFNGIPLLLFFYQIGRKMLKNFLRKNIQWIGFMICCVLLIYFVTKVEEYRGKYNETLKILVLTMDQLTTMQRIAGYPVSLEYIQKFKKWLDEQ